MATYNKNNTENEEKLKKLFKIFDRDGDGHISVKEL
jgi:Ca2+-binding EF-hand superfamily protein